MPLVAHTAAPYLAGLLKPELRSGAAWVGLTILLALLAVAAIVCGLLAVRESRPRVKTVHTAVGSPWGLGVAAAVCIIAYAALIWTKFAGQSFSPVIKSYALLLISIGVVLVGIGIGMSGSSRGRGVADSFRPDLWAPVALLLITVVAFFHALATVPQ